MTAAKRAQPHTTTQSKQSTPSPKLDLVKPTLRTTFVDLSKLRKTSLKRYKKYFNLDVKADSKTELLEAVGRHFATMPVREADVALEFHNFARALRAKRALVHDAGPATAAQTTTGAVVDAMHAAAGR